MYALDPIFASLLVHGDSSRSSLVAIGVLDPERAAGLVASVSGKKIAAGDMASLEVAVKDPKIKQAVMANLAKTSRKFKMNGSVRDCFSKGI
jgi:long-chain acyl-CoA synthetase